MTSRSGNRLLAFSPKDGYLYGYDARARRLLYRTPVTRIENADARINTDRETHFCPGAVGGGEWNGVAYDPDTNLLFTGTTDWCTAVKAKTASQLRSVQAGGNWTGAQASNPLDVMGTQDPHSTWGGWLHATDADTGQWRWRARAHYPILSGLTPTAGGIVLFGDMGGNFYALDAENGRKLFHQALPGAVGGGIITYQVKGIQRVAVAAGMTSGLWPVKTATGKILIFGLASHGGAQ